jgi:hypothetical protein
MLLAYKGAKLHSYRGTLDKIHIQTKQKINGLFQETKKLETVRFLVFDEEKSFKKSFRRKL